MDLYDLIGILQTMFWKKDKKSQYISQEIKPKKYSFRPRTLEEYIGQDRAKQLILLNIKKCLDIKPVHFLISGTRGHGKTTLAYIIKNMLNFNIYTYIGGSFNIDNLQDFFIKNRKSDKPNILFIDEIHGLNKEIAEFLYPVIEDFILPLGNLKLRPFVLIGATTDKNILLRKFSPLVDRCGCQINLEHYTAEDIKKILKQYNEQVYNIYVSEEVYDILSKNTRYNPRTSLAMFDDFVVCRDINMVLKSHRIIINSLTTDDIVVLKHLEEVKKPVGLEVLAIITQQTKEDYISITEPFLLQEGYISRTSKGRIITEKGKEILQKANDILFSK